MQSEIRNMSLECDRVGGINLSQGICDLPLDPALSEAVNNAMLQGHNHYTRYDGVDELRTQIANKTRTFNKMEVSPDNIIVSAGATGALYSACYALLSPGDEVIMFEPYYGYHEYTFLSLGLVPVYSKFLLPNWEIDFEQLESIVTKRTKAIIICTPSNPCGKVFGEEELKNLGDFCMRHDLLVFTDEIYEYITYEGHSHISPASLPEFAGRTVTVSGYSKTFSITGWRIGYCIADTEIVKWIGNASDLLYVCAPAPLQYGVANGIKTIPPEFYENLRTGFAEKRDLLCATLSKIGLSPIIPQGAYYILADVSALPGATSKEKTMHMLAKTGVGAVPGSAFYHGQGGEDLVRFCFAKDIDVIRQACRQLERIV